MMNAGRVLFVGAGPGDPKLLTIRGKEALQKADVVVYDRLANPLLLSHVRRDARLVYCGKERDRHTLPQEEINLLLIREAKQGKTVVRLKGGDPSMFGRVGEEAQMCVEHGVPYEIVPGITSGMAAPLYAGIPLTHRDYNSSVAFVTGHLCDKNAGKGPDWTALARMETLVIYMGVKNLPHIQAQLLASGKSGETPVALVRWGTVGEQQTLVGSLATIDRDVANAGFSAPAIIIVGEVVRLREQLNWYESRPLFGQRVAIAARPGGGGDVLASRLEQLGAEVIAIPLVKRPLQAGDAVFPEELAAYGWILLDDVQQAEAFLAELGKRRFDLRRLTCRLAVRGKQAALYLESRGLYPERVFDHAATSAAMSRELARDGERILHVRANGVNVLAQGATELLHLPAGGVLEWDEMHPAASWMKKLTFDWFAAADEEVLPALADFAGAGWESKPLFCADEKTRAVARQMGWRVVSTEEPASFAQGVRPQEQIASAACTLYGTPSFLCDNRLA
ncbi:uroporphyrinogen-III C-methyltransferase [Brevibacillus gelatini]|uniref:uroporphyrinogen-III C-methyltransferase n=1 Tax=Brevibacillus gelatini TaxID=1655277 RepID=UPI003D817216